MKKYFIILGCIQAFIALGAIPAGIGYLSDISGNGMGTSVELLNNSPFTNYLIPALFLLVVNGIGNVLGAVISFRKNPTAGKIGFVLGIILCMWIIIQVHMIGFISFLQPLLFGVGLAELIMGLVIYKKA